MIDMNKVTAAWLADQAAGTLAEWLPGYTHGDAAIDGQAHITHHTDNTYRVTDGSKSGPVKRFRVTVEVDELCGAVFARKPGQEPCCKPVNHATEAPDTDWKRDYHSNGLLKWRVDGADMPPPTIMAEPGRLFAAPLDDPERFVDIGHTKEGVTFTTVEEVGPVHTRAWARVNDQGMVDRDAPLREVDPAKFWQAWGDSITADVERLRRPLDERQPAGDLVERLAAELHILWGTDFEDGSGDALETAREILGRLGILPEATDA